MNFDKLKYDYKVGDPVKVIGYKGAKEDYCEIELYHIVKTKLISLSGSTNKCYCLMPYGKEYDKNNCKEVFRSQMVPAKKEVRNFRLNQLLEE